MEGGDNLKGLLFCERPNQVKQPPSDQKKPFLTRVFNSEQVGLNPVKKESEQTLERPKKINEVLKRHKEWLDVYKLKMKYKKEMKEDAVKDEKEKFEKIKQQAAENRQRTRKMKEEFDSLNKKIMDDLDEDGVNNDQQQKKQKTYKLTEANLKKLNELNSVVPKNQTNNDNIDNDNQDGNEYDAVNNFLNNENDHQQDYQPQNNSASQKNKKNKSNKKQKPKKRQFLTDEQYEAQKSKEEDAELDDLLGFVDTLDYDKYINDLEVQTMVQAIKDRVSELQKDENWREKAKQRIQQRREEIRRERQGNNNNDDNMSTGAISEGSRSVASERTQQSIQSLKDQMKERDEGRSNWDKNTKGETVTIEEKIAKLVADEVLRNYKNLGQVHSNRSIRTLLESEANKQLQPSRFEVQQRYDGPNVNIVKERTLRRDQIDPNTLPYMHRNPAI